MFHFTEIKCRDWTGEWNGYFYVNARRPLRKVQDIDAYHVPDGARLIIDDNSWEPVEITNLSIFQYIYRKYFKRYFRFGYRVNWEKELKRR